MGTHFVAKHFPQAAKERRLVGRAEKIERVLVDVDHADFAHATLDEFRMHVGKHPEVTNALPPRVVEKLPDSAEILDPERNRRMLEKALCVFLAERKFAAGGFAFGDVLDRHQHTIPIASEPGRTRPRSWMSRRWPDRV